jgi:DNA-binding transcriptional ArsR family regulator
MTPETRRRITEPAALEALAHPARLALIDHLMAAGPATASACARAVGDTPSNCSYHLRVLAKIGLVGAVASADGRERPWQTLVTGFDTGSEDPDVPMSPQESKLLAVSVQRDQQLLREYFARRDREPSEWRQADFYNAYTLRIAARELRELTGKLDALIRPYIAATRDTPPPDADLVHVAVDAFRVSPVATPDPDASTP